MKLFVSALGLKASGSKEKCTKALYPWETIGRYADDEEVEVDGSDEEGCMTRLVSMIGKHGDLVWYSGVSDEDYVAGECIGRENLICD